MLTLEDVVNGPSQLMGIKAVWGLSSEAVMCFGGRGNAELKDHAFFALARSTAQKAIERPYFVTIGGGKHVPQELNGRVLELVRATRVFGETNAFVADEMLREQLTQWPVAVVLLEVYEFKGQPHLVDDLGFEDRKILTNAFDAVIHRSDDMAKLWHALERWPMERRWSVLPPPGFREPEALTQCGTMFPTLTMRKSEGKRVYKLQMGIERDRTLKRIAKDQNRAANGGQLVCEACSFRDNKSSMFDAHHRHPLAAGVRESRADDLVILCPTCHRWAHSMAPDMLSPLSIEEIRIGVASVKHQLKFT